LSKVLDTAKTKGYSLKPQALHMYNRYCHTHFTKYL